MYTGMGRSSILGLAALGVLGYLFYKSKSPQGSSEVGLSPTPGFNVSQGQQGTTYYVPSVIPNLKIATPARILSTGTETFVNQAGKKVISNITVTAPARNAQGQTALDLRIAANNLASSANKALGKTMTGYDANNKAIWK